VTKRYRVKAAVAGEIQYESAPVLPSLYPIPIKKGWNWIGYTPDGDRPLSAALSALTAASGDVVRSQIQFAEWSGGVWSGSLAQMSAGQGYMLYRSNPADGSFAYGDIYPGPALTSAVPVDPADPVTANSPASLAGLPGWDLDYRAYQYDMVVTAEVSGINLGPLHQVAAVVNHEIRGVARPVYVPALKKTLVFLMVRSNQAQGDTIRFQALDRASGKVYAVGGTAIFAVDAVIGSTAAPLSLSSDGSLLADLSVPVAFDLGASRPNPMVGDGAAVVRYAVPRASHVSLEMFDVNGRRIRTLVNAQQAPGVYDVAIDPRGLHGGVYFYRMRAESFSATRRMVIVR
jgi:hypothetical protein